MEYEIVISDTCLEENCYYIEKVLKEEQHLTVVVVMDMTVVRVRFEWHFM